MNKLFIISLLCLASMNINCYSGDDLSKEDKEYVELKKRHVRCLENLSKCSERELNIVQQELSFTENHMVASNMASSINQLIGFGLVLHSNRSESLAELSIGILLMLFCGGSYKYDVEVKNYKKAVELELDARKKYK